MTPAPRSPWSYFDRQEVSWYPEGPPLQQDPEGPPTQLEAAQHPEVLAIPLDDVWGLVGRLRRVLQLQCAYCGSGFFSGLEKFMMVNRTSVSDVSIIAMSLDSQFHRSLILVPIGKSRMPISLDMLRRVSTRQITAAVSKFSFHKHVVGLFLAIVFLDSICRTLSTDDCITIRYQFRIRHSSYYPLAHQPRLHFPYRMPL